MKWNFICCKECKDRQVGCHATCVSYNEEKEKLSKVREELTEQLKIGETLRRNEINRRRNLSHRKRI